MVVPLVVLGVVAGTSALGLGTYFGLSNQKPDVVNQDLRQTSYITQNIDQTKTNEVIIGENSEIGSLVIKDSMSLDANATAEQQQSASSSGSSGLNTNLLLVAGAAAGAVYLWRKI